MIYHELANYYDALVADDEASAQWVDYTKQYVPAHSTILELACGSGEISLALATNQYTLEATDLSMDMIGKAISKQSGESIRFKQMDMLNFTVNKCYDAVICFCDSINYLQGMAEMKQVFSQVYAHLKQKGVFLFDMHALERLEEFREEYIEEGHIDDVPYQWTILSQGKTIQQHFAFWTKGGLIQENHLQTVFDPKEIEKALIECGFEVEIKTDFILEGIQKGEKIFFMGRKVE